MPRGRAVELDPFGAAHRVGDFERLAAARGGAGLEGRGAVRRRETDDERAVVEEGRRHARRVGDAAEHAVRQIAEGGRPLERIGHPGDLQRIGLVLVAERRDLPDGVGDRHEAILNIVGQRHGVAVGVDQFGQQDLAHAPRGAVRAREHLDAAIRQTPLVACRGTRCAHERRAGPPMLLRRREIAVMLYAAASQVYRVQPRETPAEPRAIGLLGDIGRPRRCPLLAEIAEPGIHPGRRIPFVVVDGDFDSRTTGRRIAERSVHQPHAQRRRVIGKRGHTVGAWIHAKRQGAERIVLVRQHGRPAAADDITAFVRLHHAPAFGQRGLRSHEHVSRRLFVEHLAAHPSIAERGVTQQISIPFGGDDGREMVHVEVDDCRNSDRRARRTIGHLERFACLTRERLELRERHAFGGGMDIGNDSRLLVGAARLMRIGTPRARDDRFLDQRVERGRPSGNGLVVPILQEPDPFTRVRRLRRGCRVERPALDLGQARFQRSGVAEERHQLEPSRERVVGQVAARPMRFPARQLPDFFPDAQRAREIAVVRVDAAGVGQHGGTPGRVRIPHEERHHGRERFGTPAGVVRPQDGAKGLVFVRRRRPPDRLQTLFEHGELEDVRVGRLFRQRLGPRRDLRHRAVWPDARPNSRASGTSDRLRPRRRDRKGHQNFRLRPDLHADERTSQPADGA